MEVNKQLSEFLPLLPNCLKERKILMDFTYRSTILGGIIMTKDIKLRQSSNSYLLYVRHEVVWDAFGIFTNFPTLMSPDRIEVPQQNNLPIWVCIMHISSNFFKEKLVRVNLMLEKTGCIPFMPVLTRNENATIAGERQWCIPWYGHMDSKLQG